MGKLTTLDMELRLIRYFNHRVNTIVPNVSWGLSVHECDLLILTPGNYLTEVEIKVSLSDLRADKLKTHGHANSIISRLYFAIPDYLQEYSDLIPENAGILIARTSDNAPRTPGLRNKEWFTGITKVREAKFNKFMVKDSVRNDLQRLGTMRIYGLKDKINRLQKRLALNETQKDIAKNNKNQ